jgi:uncharacterized protein (TIGR03437 family)
LQAGTPIDASGSGRLGPFFTEVNLTNATQLLTFANLFLNPTADYINLHTNQHTPGVMRAQLRPTEVVRFPVLMSSANEPGTPTVTATAPGTVTLHVLRNEDGSVAAGTVFFDINFRFPGAAQFTGLHIHDAAAGVNGPITVPIVPQFDAAFSSDSGFGNYYNWTPGMSNLAVLEDILNNPENHYVNLHTSADAGGAVRAQLGAPIGSPSVTAAFPANRDRTATTVAPGGLLTISGANLVKTAGDLSGWAGRTVPFALNGTSVTVGGRRAAILSVSRTEMLVQVPVDTPTETQPVVVTSVVGASSSFNVNVAATAPAIFFEPVAAVLKNSDYSLVSSSNPAAGGDIVLVFATGLGATTPALATGAVAPAATFARTADLTATVGGQNASVVYSMASPGYVGLYQTAIRIPTGVTGTVPLVLQQGSTRSNSVNIAVR